MFSKLIWEDIRVVEYLHVSVSHEKYFIFYFILEKKPKKSLHYFCSKETGTDPFDQKPWDMRDDFIRNLIKMKLKI